MHRVALGARALPLVFLAALAACGEGRDPGTGPSPIVNTITDRFEATLGANHARTHAFVSGSGIMTATLTSVAPDDTTILGVSLGTWNGAACQLVVANDEAKQGVTVTAQASSPGNFCVRVSDVGFIAQPTTYVIEVVHRD